MKALTPPFRIIGYAGQHDEAGAVIVDSKGRSVCSTPGITGNNPEAWANYREHNEFVLNALNSYAKEVTNSDEPIVRE